MFCLVYAVDDERSMESVRSLWLPKVREVNKLDSLCRPVILVGNKDDLLSDMEGSPLEEVNAGHVCCLQNFTLSK